MCKTVSMKTTTTKTTSNGKNPIRTQKCNGCKKMLALTCFDAKIVKGVQSGFLSKCKVCRPKSIAADKRFNQSDAGKDRKKRYKESDAGKEANKRFKQSDAGKQAEKRSRQSDAGKARNKRSRQSNAGKEARKRELEVQNIRKFADPSFQMSYAMKSLSAHILSGDVAESPCFEARSSFGSTAAYRQHIQSELVKYNSVHGTSFRMKDYGTLWQVEHKVPREAYDHSNPLDVKRCWSPSNTQILTPTQNMEKSYLLIEELCIEVLSAGCQPLAWGSALPSKEETDAFYARIKQGWTPTREQKDAYDAYKFAKLAKKNGGAGSSNLQADDESDESDDDEYESDESDDDGSPMEVPQSE